MRIEPAGSDAVDALATLLVDCVEGGASVGFLSGVTHGEAAAFWRRSLEADGTSTWVARLQPDGTVVGSVQLLPAKLPNGAHRGEVAKLLVHRSARGRGVGTALMRHVEQEALERGRWLLLLDTETGSPAQQLYERCGWQVVGVLEDHAVRPHGGLAATTFLAKRLRPA